MPNRAILLLIYVGVMTGLNFPLGKLAAQAGVPPALWAMIISLGASIVLLPAMVAQGAFLLPRGAMLRYVVLAGLITFVAANLLVFAALPHIGAGHVGLMFALSPVFTLGLSALVGLRVPGGLGLTGIGLGMIGACLVALERGGVSDKVVWTVAAFGIPALLAIGNVYRTLDWPKEGRPEVLAFWSHATAAMTFAAILLLHHGHIPVQGLAEIPVVTMLQMVIAGVTFPAFFLLQRLGGPVLLSQIGYVAAATGMAAGVAVLGERFGALTWGGTALIAVGVLLTVVEQSGLSMKRLARGASCANRTL